jgi:uncharacterized membrane protein YphA (DoxX/SURF4 family)
MKIAVIIMRVLLAAMYLFASVSYFLNVMPKAPEMTAAQTSFMTGIMASVYLFPLIKITELLCGIMLLIGRTAPLASIIIFPVTLNIFLYTAFLAQPKDLPMSAVMLLFNLFLIYAYRAKYLSIVSK